MCVLVMMTTLVDNTHSTARNERTPAASLGDRERWVKQNDRHTHESGNTTLLVGVLPGWGGGGWFVDVHQFWKQPLKHSQPTLLPTNGTRVRYQTMTNNMKQLIEETVE